MKDLGYYEVKGLGTCYCYETTSKENQGMTLKCDCCGKVATSWISCNYIDENDNEVEAIYGTTCFKKISVKEKSIKEI